MRLRDEFVSTMIDSPSPLTDRPQDNDRKEIAESVQSKGSIVRLSTFGLSTRWNADIEQEGTEAVKGLKTRD